MKINIKKSKEMSYLLRHDPKDLTIDKNGWVSVSDLLSKLKISQEELDLIVIHNDKKRFGYNLDKTMIRARQGHSLKVDVELKKVKNPPFTLYHGTKKDHVESILKNGLGSMTRNHVHLSKDLETATNVANRRKGDNVILEIEAKRMFNDKVDIYISENEVYLCKFIDSKYIKM